MRLRVSSLNLATPSQLLSIPCTCLVSVLAMSDPSEIADGQGDDGEGMQVQQAAGEAGPEGGAGGADDAGGMTNPVYVDVWEGRGGA